MNNILSNCKSYSVKHILVAFENSSDASTTELHPRIGRCGKSILGNACGGKGIVLLNEFMTTRHVVIEARSTFDYYSPNSLTTTSMVGEMIIADRTAGLFSNFLKRTSERLGVSEAHIAFSWKIFFVGIDQNNEEIIIPVNQLVFNMVHFTQSFAEVLGRRYNLMFVATYNTFGQLPNFVNNYQCNITHKDGNLHKTIPQPTGVTSGIIPRVVEDGIKYSARNERLEKSKPMITLKDIIDAYAIELDEMKFTHKAQLQHWLSIVNSNYVKKISEPKQLIDLPINYKIKLDDRYTQYQIDNRNIIFEQPYQDQRIVGIRTFSVPVGMTIPAAIDSIMILSKSIGLDAMKDEPESYRSNVCVIKTCAQEYDVNVEIKKIKIPKNTIQINTGPGESAIDPISLTFQDGLPDDTEIVSIFLKSLSDPLRKVLEKPVESPEAIVVYGNREQTTAERVPGVEFFKSGFTGLRSIIGQDTISSVENNELYGNLISLIKKQSTHYSISIRGNPYLLNDLHRLPTDVAASSQGNAILYKFPELQPLYLKLLVKIKPDLNKLASDKSSGVDDGDDENMYYYESWMHMFSITNLIKDGKFEQNIELVRTDEII